MAVIEREKSDSVVLLRLNRPEKRNALTIAMRFELADLLEEIAVDETASVVVITGAPPASCDIRIGSAHAVFGHPEIDRGVPAPFGALIAMMPDQLARELAFTGRLIHADEALRAGILRQIAEDPLAASMELAHRIAKTPRSSPVRSKALMLAAAADGPPARAAAAELKMFREAMLP